MPNFIKLTSKTAMIKHLEKVMMGPVPKKRVQELRADWDKKFKPGMIAGVYKITKCPFLNEAINTTDQIRLIEVGSEDYNRFVLKDEIPFEISQPIAVLSKHLQSLFKLKNSQVIKVLEQLRDFKAENDSKNNAKK